MSKRRTIADCDATIVMLRPACGKEHMTGSILLDLRLRASMERVTTTHWAPCPEHQAQIDDGYIILVAIDPDKSGPDPDADRVASEDAYRTGAMVTMRAHVFDQLIDSPRPTGGIAYCFPEVVEKLAKLNEHLT